MQTFAVKTDGKAEAFVLTNKALAFIQRSQQTNPTPFHNLLIDRCIAHLQEHADVSSSAAELAAIRALAEYECRQQRPYIDVNRSHERAVIVQDPDTGKSLVFSAACLVRLAQLIRIEQHHPPPPTRKALWVSVDPCGASPTS